MKNKFERGGPDFLKVRISISMLKCTYNCEYCVAAAGQSQINKTTYINGMERPTWGENGLELSKKALHWVTSLPYQVGVRYDVHGEPFLNDDVIQAISWLTHQQNVSFVEVQTNASMLRVKLTEHKYIFNLTKLKLFCTFHHSQVSPETFIDNILFIRSLGVHVIVNVLVFNDNLLQIANVLELCREHDLQTSADIRYSGFTVPLTGDGKRARHFLKQDPFQVFLEAEDFGSDVFRVIADSGPLGKDIRFLAAMLVGIYGLPGRLCSAGHDYIFVDKWGDVYRCFCYADVNKSKMGSVLDLSFVPKLRKKPYAQCHYRETCHQKEEYGNLKILREHRNLRQMSLNNFCGADLNVEPQKLYDARMTLIELARHTLKHDRKGLFFAS